MAVYAICDECDREYRLPDEMAGKRIRCKGCRAGIEIPERSRRAPGSGGRRSSRSASLRQEPSLYDSPRGSRRYSDSPSPSGSRPRRTGRRQVASSGGGLSFWQIRLLVGGVAALIAIVGSALGVIEAGNGRRQQQPQAQRWQGSQQSAISGLNSYNSPSADLANMMEQSRRETDRMLEEQRERSRQMMEDMRRQAEEMSKPPASMFPNDPIDPGGSYRSRFGDAERAPSMPGSSRYPGAGGSYPGTGGRYPGSGFPR